MLANNTRLTRTSVCTSDAELNVQRKRGACSPENSRLTDSNLCHENMQAWFLKTASLLVIDLTFLFVFRHPIQATKGQSMNVRLCARQQYNHGLGETLSSWVDWRRSKTRGRFPACKHKQTPQTLIQNKPTELS